MDSDFVSILRWKVIITECYTVTNNVLCAMAENRTRVECLEGIHANHYTTIAAI